jgi:hypothetical protein
MQRKKHHIKNLPCVACFGFHLIEHKVCFITHIYAVRLTFPSGKILVKFENYKETPGHAVAQLVEALRYKVAGSIPDGVIGIFIDIVLPAALWP